MKHIIIFGIGIFLLSIASCTKEGKGGAASVEGKILVRIIKEGTFDTLTIAEAQDEEVYIVYGDNTSYDDDVHTSYNGNFRFDYLYKGNYTIFVYSDCPFLIETCPNKSIPILKEFTITKGGEKKVLDDIIINKLIK